MNLSMTGVNVMKDYGTKIQVGNGKINVYSEGNGDNTIVMLSGAGVSSPVLEYRPLYRIMSDRYRIAVTEKSGYGLTESTGTTRTVENMVNENRGLFRKRNEKRRSMRGLYRCIDGSRNEVRSL